MFEGDQYFYDDDFFGPIYFRQGSREEEMKMVVGLIAVSLVFMIITGGMLLIS